MICADCVERTEAPRTSEGQRALSLLSQSGVWKRMIRSTAAASISTIVGLDAAELRARAPSDLVEDALSWGLAAEAAVIAASERAALAALEAVEARARA